MGCQVIPHTFFSKQSQLPMHKKHTRPTTPPNSSTFDLTVLCPSLILGDHPLSPSRPTSLSYFNGQIRNITHGEYLPKKLPNLPTLL